MSITFRNYAYPTGITEGYYALRAFFLKRGGTDFPFGRWDWMITHGWLDHGSLHKIGIWEEAGEIVGAALFDTQPGEGFICVLPGYEALRAEMVRYARENLRRDGKFRLLVWDADPAFQETAALEGFVPTPDKEYDAVFPLHKPADIRYTLPEGFCVRGMDEGFDVEKYGQVLWKGFNHELNGEGPLDLSDQKRRQLTDEMFRPHVDLNLKIASRRAKRRLRSLLRDVAGPRFAGRPGRAGRDRSRLPENGLGQGSGAGGRPALRAARRRARLCRLQPAVLLQHRLPSLQRLYLVAGKGSAAGALCQSAVNLPGRRKDP